MRYALIFFVFTLPVPTCATTVLVLYTPSAIYIASDSQISKIDGSEARSGCKIHVSEHFVWASAGLLYETAGPFDIRNIVQKILRQGPNFVDAMDQLEREITIEYPGARDRAIALGAKPLQAITQTVVADSDFTSVGMIYAHDKSVERRQCPGKTCNSAIGLLELGEHGEVDRILDERHSIWKEMGIAEAFDYLITAQKHKTPLFVSGPIAIVQLSGQGIKWIQYGACTPN